jgi:Transposase and inactivated derivatives
VDEVRSVLFGLEGFDVLDAVETADGRLVVTVETTDPVLACPECGTPAGRSRGRPVVALRDLCSAGRRVRVWWRKHRNECPDADCDRRSFTEQHAAVGPRRRTTARCRAWIGSQVGPEGRAVSAVSREVGVSWPTGMRSVYETAVLTGITECTVPTRHLGVDETAFRARHRWVTNIADLGAGRELDVFEGRSAASLRRVVRRPARLVARPG